MNNREADKFYKQGVHPPACTCKECCESRVNKQMGIPPTQSSPKVEPTNNKYGCLLLFLFILSLLSCIFGYSYIAGGN